MRGRSVERVEAPERVECIAGPLDGTEIEIVPGAPEVEVTMADGTRHRYAREQPSDPPCFHWAGRR